MEDRKDDDEDYEDDDDKGYDDDDDKGDLVYDDHHQHQEADGDKDD